MKGEVEERGREREMRKICKMRWESKREEEREGERDKVLKV